MTESKPWWTEPQVDLFGLDSKDHYVYRYRSASRAIQELRTRMSSFKELNDPKGIRRLALRSFFKTKLRRL